MAAYRRVWRVLSGDDTTARAGLPISEVLAPLPLLALALLVVNDWILKGSSIIPGAITGKLSDVTGVFVFPLVAVAVCDLVLAGLAKVGLAWDHTLRRSKLAIAIAFTAIVFAAIKLSPVIGGVVERAWATIVPSARLVYDPTDLVALLALAGTWWHGRLAIARGAHGRLALAKARHAANRPLASPFADAAACGADRAVVADLETATAAWLDGGPAAPVDAALAKLRA